MQLLNATQLAAVEVEVLGAIGRAEAVVGAEHEAGVAAVAGALADPAGEAEGAGEVLGGGKGGRFEAAVDDLKRGCGLREDQGKQEVTHGGARFGLAAIILQWVPMPNFGGVGSR